MNSDYKNIVIDGLWKNNPGLVQLLGLCPLLAVSNSMINGIGLGLATTLVLVASNTSVSIVRNWVPNEIRVPVFVMFIAAFVSSIQLLISAYTYELYKILGIFIPLIVTNCAILGRADAFAAKNPVPKAMLDGLMQGLGFALVLIILGGMRELLGNGTLFSRFDLIFGEFARNWEIRFFPNDAGFLFAILPPGAFIGLGLLVAIKNWIDDSVVGLTQASTTEHHETQLSDSNNSHI